MAGNKFVVHRGINLRGWRSTWWEPLLLPLMVTALCWESWVLGMLMQGGGKKIGSKGPNWHTDWFDGKLGRQDVWSYKKQYMIYLSKMKYLNLVVLQLLVFHECRVMHVPWFRTTGIAFLWGIRLTNMIYDIWHTWNCWANFLPGNGGLFLCNFLDRSMTWRDHTWHFPHNLVLQTLGMLHERNSHKLK